MNSGHVSQQSSQASSRMQSPLIVKTIPRHPFAYSVRKFINKIPPIIKYGVPGVAIGGLAPYIYQAAKNHLQSKCLRLLGSRNKFNKLTNSINETQQTKTNMPSPPSPHATSLRESTASPSETPIPRSTYDPSHPRTGYRFHAPFD